MIKVFITGLVGTLAVAAVSASAAPINLVTNGSFEASGGSFAGYTIGGTSNGVSPGTGPQVITYGPNATAYGDNVAPDPFTFSPDATGTHAAFFVDDQAAETISQTINLVAGSQYEIGFDFYETRSGANNPNPFSLTESIAGTTLTSVTNNGFTPGTWYHSFNVFTPSATGPAQFTFAYNSGTSPAKDVIVDDVYVQLGNPSGPVPAPEPASLAMLGASLLGLVAVRRRRTGF